MDTTYQCRSSYSLSLHGNALYYVDNEMDVGQTAFLSIEDIVAFSLDWHTTTVAVSLRSGATFTFEWASDVMLDVADWESGTLLANLLEAIGNAIETRAA